MNIEQLPSGSYRVTETINKVRYRATFDHKPNKNEIRKALSEKIKKYEEEHSKSDCMTLRMASEEYCKSKENTLSPKTIREYYIIIRNMPEWLLEKDIHEIVQLDLNNYVNEMARTLSPKTIKNRHGFVSSVIETYRPEFRIKTSLPQKKKQTVFIPSAEQQKELVNELMGTEYFIPVVLGSFGLRRSEICALTIDDVDGRIIHVNKALVENKDNEWIVKVTKNTESERDVIIPEWLSDMIVKQGYIYKGHPGGILRAITRAQEKLGMPHFSEHKLRHFFASRMHSLGIVDADIMRMGGWKTDEVMKTVYRHSMIEKEKDSLTLASDKFASGMFD